MHSSLRQNRRLLFYTLFLAYICAGIISILPGPTLPLLAMHAGVPLAIAGWAFTSSATGFMLGAFIAGIVGSRSNAKYALMAGLGIMACAGIVTAWTHSFLLLLAAQFLMGLGFGFLDVSINVIVSLSFEDTLGETLNNLHSSYGIGALLAPLFLSLVLQLTHDAIGAYVVGSLVGFIVIFLLIRQRIPSVAKQNKTVQRQNPPIPRSVFRQALLWLMALQLCLYVGAEVGFSNWIVTAVSQSAVISLILAAPAATAFWLGLTIGRLLGAQLLKRGILSETQLLYISVLGGCISGLVLAAFVGQIGVSFAASALIGLFFGPIYPGITAMALRWFVYALSTVSAVMLISAGLAAMILPVLMGFLILPIGINWVMTIPALVCLSIAIPLTIALRRQRRTLHLRSVQHTMEQETILPIIPQRKER
jgi:fucose permease